MFTGSGVFTGTGMDLTLWYIVHRLVKCWCPRGKCSCAARKRMCLGHDYKCVSLTYAMAFYRLLLTIKKQNHVYDSTECFSLWSGWGPRHDFLHAFCVNSISVVSALGFCLFYFLSSPVDSKVSIWRTPGCKWPQWPHIKAKFRLWVEVKVIFGLTFDLWCWYFI